MSVQREADNPNTISGGNCNNIIPVQVEPEKPECEIIKCPWCNQILPREHYCIDYL